MRLRAQTHCTLMCRGCVLSLRILCSCSRASALAAFPIALMYMAFSSCEVCLLARRFNISCWEKCCHGNMLLWRKMTQWRHIILAFYCLCLKELFLLLKMLLLSTIKLYANLTLTSLQTQTDSRAPATHFFYWSATCVTENIEWVMQRWRLFLRI